MINRFNEPNFHRFFSAVQGGYKSIDGAAFSTLFYVNFNFSIVNQVHFYLPPYWEIKSMQFEEERNGFPLKWKQIACEFAAAAFK